MLEKKDFKKKFSVSQANTLWLGLYPPRTWLRTMSLQHEIKPIAIENEE